MNKKIPIVLVNLLMITGCSGGMIDLGVDGGKLKPCPDTSNCVNSQATDEKHYIQPIHFKGTQLEAQGRLLQMIEKEKRTKVLTTQENYVRAEFTSALFRFIDDVEFYFPGNHTEQTIIHVRSASRVGSFDFGANRKRIERIRGKF